MPWCSGPPFAKDMEVLKGGRIRYWTLSSPSLSNDGEPDCACCGAPAGFFAKDMEVFKAAASVLLDPSTRRPTRFRRLLVARDAFAVADADVRAALFQARGKRGTLNNSSATRSQPGQGVNNWEPRTYLLHPQAM